MRTIVGPRCHLGNFSGWSLPSICEGNRGGVVQWSVGDARSLSLRWTPSRRRVSHAICKDNRQNWHASVNAQAYRREKWDADAGCMLPVLKNKIRAPIATQCNGNVYRTVMGEGKFNSIPNLGSGLRSLYPYCYAGVSGDGLPP